MAADSNASGVATFAGANMVGIGNLIALLALAAGARLDASAGRRRRLGFGAELARQGAKLALGAAIAVLCYGLYALATRVTRARRD